MSENVNGADVEQEAASSAEPQTAEQEPAEQEPAESEQEAAQQSGPDHLARLEEEGDIAADYLEELLDIADLDGDIDIDVAGDRASVEIRGAGRLEEINAPGGELMDALQELARLAVQARTGERSRLMLDIGGLRASHRTELEQLAQDAIEQVRTTGEDVPLRPLNAFERKVVHDAVKQAGLRSDSEGEGKNRHVVIRPAL